MNVATRNSTLDRRPEVDRSWVTALLTSADGASDVNVAGPFRASLLRGDSNSE